MNKKISKKFKSNKQAYNLEGIRLIKNFGQIKLYKKVFMFFGLVLVELGGLSKR